MYFMKNFRKNQKRKGSTHDCSWRAPDGDAHVRLPMHDSRPHVLRRIPRAGHHRDEDEQHEGRHEDVQRTCVPMRVDEQGDRLVADLSEEHRAPVKNDRQEAVERPRPEDGQRARQHSAVVLAESGTPVEVERSAMTWLDDSREGCRHKPDEQERGSHEGHHREALRTPSSQQAVRNRQQDTRQHVEDCQHDLHLSPRFLGLEMCDFDQATMAQSDCFYPTIFNCIRQGQQKIRTLAIS